MLCALLVSLCPIVRGSNWDTMGSCQSDEWDGSSYFGNPQSGKRGACEDQQTLLIIRVINYNVSNVLAGICGHCWAGQQSSCRENEGCMARGHCSPGSWNLEICLRKAADQKQNDFQWIFRLLLFFVVAVAFGAFAACLGFCVFSAFGSCGSSCCFFLPSLCWLAVFSRCTIMNEYVSYFKNHKWCYLTLFAERRRNKEHQVKKW